MKKKDWYIVVGIFVLSVLLDQISKWIVVLFLSEGSVMLGPFGFMVSKSASLLLSQTEIFHYVKIISSFGFSVLILLLLFVLNLMLISRLIGLRIGMAVFAAGMMGESIDGLYRGAIIDWIVIFNSHLNLTDIYIIIGCLMTVFFCVKDRSIIFRKFNIRKKLLVEKDQYLFCGYIMCTYFLFTFAYCMFFLTFMQIFLNNSVKLKPVLHGDITTVFLVLFSILSFCFLIIIGLFVIYLSNKVYGPVYAFKKFIKDILLSEKPVRTFKLRTGDHFNNLCDLAHELQSKYRKKKK